MAHFDLQAFIDEKMLEEMQRLVAENDRLHSWDGIMSVVNEVYPATVFDGSSGDIGAQMIVLMREVARLHGALFEVIARAVLVEGTTWKDTANEMAAIAKAALDAAGGAE